MSIQNQAELLARRVATATNNAQDEANLRHEVEHSLREACTALGIPYTPYQLERRVRGRRRNVGFADVVHGAVIIEYEPPKSFGGGKQQANLTHAKGQAEDYAERMAHDEGRPLTEYHLVAWDGAHITFGTIDDDGSRWGRLTEFNDAAATRLLTLIRDQGRPLVHPGILRTLVGPESEVGARLIPVLFNAVLSAASNSPGASQTKTTLLFKEWNRLFGSAVGIPTDRLQQFLARQAQAHGAAYERAVPCYLFALHTYIGLVAKLVAALALPNASQDIADHAVPLQRRLQALERGTLFSGAGIANMLSGDFFSWPVDDPAWGDIEPPLESLLLRLDQVSFDMTRKNPESVRDLFKGIYEEFVPRELRHALGEVYTPDWLAAHALDELEWTPQNDLLDPTCGTGTFLLEAVRRRLVHERDNGRRLSAHEVLDGIYGMDLNPLAVLAAKASMVVVLADRLDPSQPVRLPVFLADAINTAEPTTDGFFEHRLQTERGIKQFRIPAAIAHSEELHEFFERMRSLVVADLPPAHVMAGLDEYMQGMDDEQRSAVEESVDVLVDLHRQRWDGIWCSILADRFAAGSIPRVSHIAGNPPWVKWSHLPPQYAEFIKPLCQAINVFSEDRFVGGIESDISTVITFQAIRKWLAEEGRLAFFITASVFSNESSQGFRRFADANGNPMCAVLAVEDLKALRAFDGVTNHPALLIVEQGRETEFPVPYRIWSPPENGTRTFVDGADFRHRAAREDLLAEPVLGTDSGPWLKGTQQQHELWRTIFDADGEASYVARKGVTTDRNGIYFLRVERAGRNGNLIRVENDPDLGRISNIQRVAMNIEAEHVFPLMRGRGLRAFRAEPDPEYRILVAQRGMHGDPALLQSTPRTLSFLMEFQDELLRRSSYKRFQRNQPFWSIWSTGPYTFSAYKVLWKEMSGSRFCAAYIGEHDDPVLGRKVVIPDHKLYMVPVDTLEEAQYLTGILNAPSISSAISAYAAQLSLGTSVIEYLKIPSFDAQDAAHRQIVELCAEITGNGGPEGMEDEMSALDEVCLRVVTSHTRKRR